MKIDSFDLASTSRDLLNSLESLRSKINNYANLEVEKNQGSNFLFELDENELIWLKKIERVLFERENMSLISDIVDQLYDYRNQYAKKLADFDTLMTNIFKSENGSLDAPFFYSSFFAFVREYIFLIKDLYLLFLDKFDIIDIKNNLKNINNIIGDTKKNQNVLEAMRNEAEEKLNTLITKYKQKVAEREVLDIKKYYESFLKIIKRERNWYGIMYFISVISFITVLILVYLNDTLMSEKFLSPRIIFTISIIGFITFIINDIRKRFNVSKQILDEIYQKQNIVDAYSSLLSRIEKFDDKTKELYHQEIMKIIIDTLLSVKNHGYLSKKLNQEMPNVTSSILEKVFNKKDGT